MSNYKITVNGVTYDVTVEGGGFAPAFYDAYNTRKPLQPGYADRRDLYHLYQLLNHLNLFGGSYYGSVMRILNHYT